MRKSKPLTKGERARWLGFIQTARVAISDAYLIRPDASFKETPEEAGAAVVLKALDYVLETLEEK